MTFDTQYEAPASTGGDVAEMVAATPFAACGKVARMCGSDAGATPRRLISSIDVSAKVILILIAAAAIAVAGAIWANIPAPALPTDATADLIPRVRSIERCMFPIPRQPTSREHALPGTTQAVRS